MRRSCMNELRLVYRGPRFDDGVWRALAPLGTYECFEASKISPRLHDLCRIRAPGLLLEGARDGDVLIATYAPPAKLAARHRVEATLKSLAAPQA